MEKLKQLGPSAIEMEVRLLTPDNGGSIELMAAFVDAMGAALRRRKDFELVNAYLALFMKLHGNSVVDEDGTYHTFKLIYLVLLVVLSFYSIALKTTIDIIKKKR